MENENLANGFTDTITAISGSNEILDVEGFIFENVDELKNGFIVDIRDNVDIEEIFTALNYIRVPNTGELTDLINGLRSLEADHAPDGYPCVTMGQITKLLDAMEGKK